MGPSSLDGSPLLSESRLAEQPNEPEGSLTAQLYDMESPSMQMRQEVSQPPAMDMEIERVEAEVLGLDREGLMEDMQTQRVETSPLDFGDTPRRDGDQAKASMRGHIEAGTEHTQNASSTHEEESMPESRGPIDHESVMRDAWLAEEMGRMPSLHFPGWLAFERLGQVARPHLSVDQTTCGLRVLYDDLTLQRNYIGSGLEAARLAIEQVRDYTRRVAIRSFELSCDRQMEHDALREVEEVRMRRRTGEDPMLEGERTHAEEELQARLLSDASVRELVGVTEHVKRLAQTEVARGEVLQDAVQWIGALERENRGLRDTVRDLVTSAERARQSTSRLEQRITDLEGSRRRQATTDVVNERRTKEQQIPLGQTHVSHEVEPGGVRLDIPRRDSPTEEPLGAMGMTCEEAAVVDKLMLEPDEIERRRGAEARGLDWVSPSESAVQRDAWRGLGGRHDERERVSELRDVMPQEDTSGSATILPTTLPLTPAPVLGPMDDIMHLLSSGSEKCDEEAMFERVSRMLSPDTVDKAIHDVTIRLERAQTQILPKP
ncbi:hypothetical protein CBR_g55768 [Chara braunii]|uniref:Uncharacterized protein n=1 Tax=Chara braunii TaxID=69332 RepID=A0A388MDC3_CHABU|nr:hypothetical protein CBR_g55768 [Chara braunii]|eukprot:GBG92495.1 hypothetical protein CBR_g55768 [Chara braunii]